MKKEEIKEKYADVGNMLENALAGVRSAQLVGEEENSESDRIISVLEKINTDFKSEIERLEGSSEWDKYCVAFFGETNSGKSTIIESLRIIYDEEQRRAELSRKEKEYVSELSVHCEEYEELLSELRKINDDLSEKKNQRLVLKVLKEIGLVLIGIIIGCFLSYFGLMYGM